MFEQFSRSYYMGRLYVEPGTGEQVTMCREQHEQLNRELYASGEGVERLDLPLVMKLDSAHLTVHPEAGVPADTLSVPEPFLDNSTGRNLPTLKEVLLAKADRASQLLRIHGAAVTPGDEHTDGPGPDGPVGT